MYSRIPENVNEAAVDEDEDEKERPTWLHSDRINASGILTRATILFTVAITIIAGTVGFSIGALVFQHSIPAMQISDTVPQGRPPSQPTYERLLTDRSAHRKLRADLPIQRKFRGSTNRSRSPRTDLEFPHTKRSGLRP